MAVMDILIRARDNASRTMRKVSLASKRAEDSLENLGDTYRRIQQQMARGLDLKIDTKGFERSLDGAERKVRTVKDRILSYLNQIRNAADRGADFRLSIEGQDELRRTLSEIERRSKALDNTRINLFLSERGATSVISSLERTARALRELDGNSGRVAISGRGIEGTIRSLRDVAKELRELAGREARVYVRESGSRAVEAALDRVSRALSSLDDKTATVSLRERGGSEILSTLGRVSRAVSDLDRAEASVRVSESGAAGVIRTLGAVGGAVEDLDGKSARTSISLSGAATVESNLDRISRTLSALDGRVARVRVEERGAEAAGRSFGNLSGVVRRVDGQRASVEATTSGVPISEESLTRLTNRATLLDQTDPTVEVQMEGTGRSQAEIAGLTAAVLALNATSATINARVNGFAKSMGQMAAMERRAKSMSTRRYGLNFDSAAAILATKALGDTLGMIQEFATTSAVVHAVSVPAMIGALGGLVTTLMAVGGAAGSAAIALGQGLAGAAGSLSSVAVLGGGSLAAFGVSVFSTLGLTKRLGETFYSLKDAVTASSFAVKEAQKAVDSATPGTKKYEAAAWGLKIAQSEADQATAKFNATMAAITPQTFALGNAFDELELATVRAQGAIANRLAPDMMRWIEMALANLPRIGPHFLDMIGAMAGVVTRFGELLTSGTQLRSLTTILMGVKDAGVPAMTILTNSVLIFINTFQAMVPTGLRVIEVMAQATETARRWTASGEGQQRIADIWALLAQRAQQLTGVAANLAVAFYGVGVALNQSGTVDRMALGMVRLSANFRDFMSATGEGRQAVTDFMVTAQPVFTAIASLAGSVVREMFRISGAIMNAKDAGSDLPLLAQLFYDVEAAVAPIGRLIEKNFVLMAPRIGPLIENIAKLAEVFLAPMPPLLAFLEVGNRFLNWFTSLDKSMQIGLAKLVSWPLALMMLSAPIGRVIGLFGRLGGGISRFAGFLGRGGGAIAGFLGRAAPLATRLPLLGGLFAALTGPIGLTIAAVVAVGVAAITLIAKWDQVKAFFSGGDVFGTFVERARGVGLAVKQFLIDSAGRLFALWQRVFPTIQRVAQSAFASLAQGATLLWSQLGPALKDIIAGFQALIPAVRFSANIIGGLLLGAFKALWPVIKLAATIIAGALVLALRAGAFVFRQIAEAVGWFFKKLQPLNPMINRVAQVIGWLFATVIVGAVAKGVQALARIFPYLQRFGPAVNALKTVFTGLYNVAMRVFSGIFNVISRWVGQAVSYLTRNWSKMRAATSTAFNVMRQLAGAVFQAIFQRISSITSRIVSWVLSRWNSLTGQTGSIFSRLRGLVSNAWNAVFRVISGVVSRIVSWVGQRLSGLRNIVSSAFNRIRGVASSAWDAVFRVISGVVARIVSSVSKRLNAMRDIVSSAFNRVRSVASTAWNAILRLVSGIVRRLVSGVSQRLDALGARVRSAFDRVRSAASTAWNAILRVVTGVVNRLVSGVLRRWDALRNQTISAFDRIRSAASSAWNTVVRVVSSAVSRIVSAVSGRWDAIVSRTQSAFGRIRSVASTAWNDLLRVIQNVAQRVAEFVVARWNSLLSRTQDIFDRIRSTALSIWRSLVEGVVRRVEDFVARVLRGWNRMLTFTRDIFSRIRSFLEEVWGRMVSAIQRRVDDLIARVQRGWTRIFEFTRNIFDRLRAFLDDVWSRVDERTRRILTDLAAWLSKHFGAVRDNAVRLFSNMREVVIRNANDMRDKAIDAARNLRNWINNAWKDLPQMAREVFGKVAAAMVDKLEGGVNDVRDWLGSLMLAISNVADAVGLDGISGATKKAGDDLKKPIKLAKGGITDGGRKVSYMAEGGLLRASTMMMARGGTHTCGPGCGHGGNSQAPTGGLANGMSPRAVYGEAGSPEAYVVKNRPTSEQLPYIKTAASWHGYQVVGPGDMHGVPEQYAEGGVRYNSAGKYGIPGGVVSTTYGSPRDYGPHNAVDVAAPMGTAIHAIHKGMVSKVGSGNTPYNIWADYGGLGAFYGHNSAYAKTGPVNPGDVIARIGSTGFSTGPHAHISVDSTVGGAMKGMWDGSVNPESLFGPGYKAGGSYTAADGSPGSSGSGLSKMQVLRELAKGAIAIGKLYKSLPGEAMGLPGQAFREGVSTIPKHVIGWLSKQAMKVVGGGGSSGGSWDGNMETRRWAEDGLKLGNAWGPVTESMIEDTQAQIQIESGGDPRAVNNWDSNAKKGTPSKGAVQAIEPTWESIRRKYGSDLGPFSSNWDNPIKSVAAGSRSMKDQWGQWMWPKTGGYSRGGVIPGAPGEEVLLKAHAGERVLPRDVVKAFDRFANQMARANQLGRLASQERAHRVDEKRWKAGAGGNYPDGPPRPPESRTSRIGTINVTVKNEIKTDGAKPEDLERAMSRLSERQAEQIRMQVIKALGELEEDGDMQADRIATGDFS